MLLKPQDVAVALQLAISDPGGWTYAGVGQGLFLSAAEVHNAVRRAVQAGLLVRIGRQAPAPSRHNLLEFLVHGVRYSFPPDLGGSTRGFPTGHAAPAFRMQFAPTGEPPPAT